MATTCEHFDLESEAPASRVVGAYRDGHPFDRVQYLESKIILKADRFNSVASFHHFGKLVRRTAKKLHVGFAADTNAWARPQVREIVFADTPDFRLYNHSFILRRRIRYQDGFPVGDPEIVLKFRHPDEETAAAVGIRPEIAGTYRMKFKMEALPLKTDIGGFRFLYSHNCVFGLSQMHDADKLSMQTLTHIFPALSELKKSEEERVTIVSEAIIEEVLLDLGVLDFGKGAVASCNVALWRTRGEHRPLVGEFAFQTKFDHKKPMQQKARKLCEQFFVTLQFDVGDWISLGTTKTGMVYRLKGNPPQSNE